jgi:hypothetical protein
MTPLQPALQECLECRVAMLRPSAPATPPRAESARQRGPLFGTRLEELVMADLRRAGLCAAAAAHSACSVRRGAKRARLSPPAAPAAWPAPPALRAALTAGSGAWVGAGAGRGGAGRGGHLQRRQRLVRQRRLRRGARGRRAVDVAHVQLPGLAGARPGARGQRGERVQRPELRPVRAAGLAAARGPCARRAAVGRAGRAASLWVLVGTALLVGAPAPSSFAEGLARRRVAPSGRARVWLVLCGRV